LEFYKQRFQNLHWIPHVQKVGSWPTIYEWYDEKWGSAEAKVGHSMPRLPVSRLNIRFDGSHSMNRQCAKSISNTGGRTRLTERHARERWRHSTTISKDGRPSGKGVKLGSIDLFIIYEGGFEDCQNKSLIGHGN
jgi:hypothetical protein